MWVSEENNLETGSDQLMAQDDVEGHKPHVYVPEHTLANAPSTIQSRNVVRLSQGVRVPWVREV